MQITASQVKELRERTGAGMMECKKALVETAGDIDLAAENMRKTGLAKADKKAGGKFWKDIRTDGGVIEVAGDYTETLARLDSQPSAIDVFGLSFYDQNRDRLKVATMSGVVPSLETIESGQYPVSRPLYFYIKDAHVGVIPGLLEYAQYFVSSQVGGMGSPLEKAGLIPMNNKERAMVAADIKARKAVN